MSSFPQQVIALLRLIPAGRLVSYGQVARVLGRPRASRMVGGVLSALGPEHLDVPWHRVVNRHGGVSERRDLFSDRDPMAEQAERLELEGVHAEIGGSYDLARYGMSDQELQSLLAGLGHG